MVGLTWRYETKIEGHLGADYTREDWPVSWFTRSPEKLRRKAAEADIRGYSSLMHGEIEQVSDSEWVSQFDAAADLGVSLLTVLQFLWVRRLVPAEDSRGRGGVTRSSVQEELAWRSQSSLGQRFIRRVKNFAQFV